MKLKSPAVFARLAAAAGEFAMLLYRVRTPFVPALVPPPYRLSYRAWTATLQATGEILSAEKLKWRDFLKWRIEIFEMAEGLERDLDEKLKWPKVFGVFKCEGTIRCVFSYHRDTEWENFFWKDFFIVF